MTREEKAVFASLAEPASLLARVAIGAMLMVAAVTACGDDDSGVPTEAPTSPTTQDGGQADEGPTEGEQEGTPGGFGTATVAVSAGDFELQLEEACVISEVGIGAIARSDEAALLIAGPQEIAVVTFELSSGEMWSAAAADVEIDGSTMSYSGPVMGPPETGSTISVQVVCDEVETGLGG